METLESEAIFAAYESLPLAEKQRVEGMARDLIVVLKERQRDMGRQHPAQFGFKQALELLGKLGIWMVGSEYDG